LNDIIHPEVQRLARQRFSELVADGAPLACYEVPLLFETGQQDRYRPVVVIAVSEATQLSRAQARDAVDAAAVAARIASQWPLSSKVAQADYVIENDGPTATTLRHADRVLYQICSDVGVAGPAYAAAPTPP
jgi:dephospho-CoA kinase